MANASQGRDDLELNCQMQGKNEAAQYAECKRAHDYYCFAVVTDSVQVVYVGKRALLCTRVSSD